MKRKRNKKQLGRLRDHYTEKKNPKGGGCSKVPSGAEIEEDSQTSKGKH